MKRKILSLILVFAMTVSLLTVGTGAVEPTYGDTAGHWAESSIERWSGHGIIQGSNGLFDPNGQLTCAQLATILAKLLKLPAAKDAGFTDNTADAWYYDAINRCAAAGILNGNGDGTVTPDAPITRERAMVMLARALGIEPIRKPDLTKYTDAAQVSAYAQGYVAALIEAGIVGGVTADELAPQDNINRASTVTILDRAISTYADKAGATVKADGKGLVLVVAENVKITGAPEGTKIVVADGATGLTVNGKAVSDDQTYIVPKTEPAKPSSGSSGGYSHSHSYDANTHKCPCGAFAPAVVATIGNTNGYLTLKEAVAAVEDGGTIKLIKDAVGSSIGTYKTPKQADANGDPQIAAKGFTIDFGGHTYTINNPASGSEGYESQGIHLERTNSIIPNVTFLNGKIAVDAKNGKAITMLVQNYCNLTLIDMVVDGSNLSDAYYKIDNKLVPGPNYTLSNNSKDGAKTLIQNTEILARSGENHVAFDSDKKSDVTVKGNSIIRGKFEVGNNASLVIIGGTFSSDPSDYVPEGYVATKSETAEIWTVGEGSTPLVAEINGVKYISLAKALAAAKDGDTVKLLDNEVVSTTVTVDKNLTLDLNGKTLTGTNCRALHITSGKLELTGTGTVKSTGIAVNSSVVRVGDDSGEARSVELVIGKDVVIDSPDSYGVGAFGTATTEKLTIYGTIKSTATTNESYDGCAVTTLGTDTSTPATIIIKEDAKISAANTNAVYLPAGSLTVEGGTITGTTGIYFKSKNMTISGGTITGSGAAQDYKYYGNGGISTGEAVTIDSCNYPGGVDSVVISGGTFTSANADAVGSYNNKGGTKQTAFITGGTFSSNPTAYVADGYVAMKNDNGTWTVIAPTAIENGVTIKGIAGYERYAFSSVSKAYDEISPKVAALAGLGQESCSADAFNAFYTDNGKITWTIYGKQTLVGKDAKDSQNNDIVVDNNSLTFGRAASYYGGRSLTKIEVKAGNESAALDLSATNGTFALPYNWWGENIKNCEVSFTGITFDGVKSIPSTWASQAQSTPYTFDSCTFNGSVYGYHDYNINLTIQNSTFNAPENTAYAVTLQSTTGINGTVTLDHNTFNGYTRGVNFQRPGTIFLFTNNTITSTVSKPDRAAIQLTDGKQFVVTGNTVDVNAGNAFWFHNAATNGNVTYTISNNNIQAPYLGYYATTFDVNPKITSSDNNFNNTDTNKCMKKDATVAEATNLTAIH